MKKIYLKSIFGNLLETKVADWNPTSVAVSNDCLQISDLKIP